MNIYTIHIKENDPNQLENAIFIKEGFSWMGSVLHVFWTLYHKLWLVSFILFAIEAILAFLQIKGYLSEGVTEALKIGLLLLIGAHFNDLYRANLARKGYVLYGVVSGKNEDDAQYKFMSEMLQRSTFGSGKGLPGLI